MSLPETDRQLRDSLGKTSKDFDNDWWGRWNSCPMRGRGAAAQPESGVDHSPFPLLTLKQACRVKRRILERGFISFEVKRWLGSVMDEAEPGGAVMTSVETFVRTNVLNL